MNLTTKIFIAAQFGQGLGTAEHFITSLLQTLSEDSLTYINM